VSFGLRRRARRRSRTSTLEVGEHELIGLIGPNGGGKSTLLKLAAGLLKPRKGTVRVFGRAPQDARDEIGYVPQFAHFPASSRSPWRRPCCSAGCGAASASAGAPRTGKPQRAPSARPSSHGSPSGRSRAVRRRAAARAHRARAGRRAALLLLDEPTSNLDQRAEEDFFNLLEKLTHRMAVVLVSHDIGFVTGFVQRVACINRTLVCHGTAELTGEVINALYGHPVRAIHHGHHAPSAAPEAR
jgi:zinc transport system ATP-binding protein